jgi:hypothetical protein
MSCACFGQEELRVDGINAEMVPRNKIAWPRIGARSLAAEAELYLLG